MDSPERIARAICEFLADVDSAVVLEDGVPVFDLSDTRYSLSTEHGKCVLHLWSAERNAVRRVVDAEIKQETLRLRVLRFGQSKPGKLEICRGRDPRTPTQKKAARSLYQRRLRTVLERHFAGFTVERLTGNMDLERSFSPVYTRGLLRRGSSGFAVLGVNAQEPQAAIDGALTFGLLWFDYCRERALQDRSRLCHMQGLKLFVPSGLSAVVRERMAHLNRTAAVWQLYELEERDGDVRELDTADRGNVSTHLVQCPDACAARERLAESIRRVTAFVPEADIVVASAAEVAFRWHGLELARARLQAEAGSLQLVERIEFGAAPNATELNEKTAKLFQELTERVLAVRRPDGPRTDPLWRIAPERWLESAVLRNLPALDERLDPACAYSQVPAFAASDRAMIDVLGATQQGRLVVIELKADEDLHLPLQGIDYWARVEWHRSRGEFEQFGYFPQRQLAPEPPLLLLVAPALHVHPATDTLLRYFAPEIDWELVGIDEHWRERLHVIFRKRATPTTETQRHREQFGL
jgi:hypothetical protein